MNATFLERFQGKTTTITKQGPEGLLRGSSDTLIYTHTHKSFMNMNSSRFPLISRSREGQQKYFEEQNKIEKNEVSLPPIGESLHLQPKKQLFELHHKGNIKGYLNKQTNWLIETNKIATPPKQTSQQIENIQRNQKQNTQKPYKKKEYQPKKTISSIKYNNKLGGLGPNIGSQDWEIRKHKHEKANNYAKQIVKINRRKKQEQSVQDWSRVTTRKQRSIL